VTAADLLSHHSDARDACAADAGCNADAVRVLRIAEQYKSSVAFLATGPGPEASHVLKLDPEGVAAGRWDPTRELAGLRHAATQLADHAASGLGAIPPVTSGPAWVLTRFVAGSSSRPLFERAVSVPWARASRTQARALAERAAQWLLAFRHGGESAGGPEPAALLEFLAERAEELERHARAGGAARRALSSARALVAATPPDAVARRYPTHGDLAPQNLHVAASGCLYVLDLEGFAVRPLDADLARFRMRLEHQALRAPWARAHANALWRAFGTVRLARDAGPFGALCYLHWLMGHLAWLSLPAALAPTRAPTGLTTALRTRLWRRDRVRWLERLPTDVDAAVTYCAEVL
jgi:aminoglycoside phosphotransferase (APT) family kinase protein